MPEPAQVPLNEIPFVPIAQIGGRLLNGGELVNLAEYAGRRADKSGAAIASLEAGIAARAAEAAEGLARADFPKEAQKQAAAKMAANRLIWAIPAGSTSQSQKVRSRSG